MKERPILFSVPMVRAILGGRKTQTRRAVKLPHDNPLGTWEPMTIGGPNGGRTADGRTIPLQGGIWHTRTGECLASPYGQPGDRLYVREAWRSTKELDPHSGGRIEVMCLDAGYSIPWAPIRYEADGERRNWQHTGTPPHGGPPEPGRYRHARFMPRWASRILLEITGVRVERLNDCSEADAEAEGIAFLREVPDADETLTARQLYECLWDSINGTGAWAANPWVWVVEFRRV
ncbi:hypothetical protein [Cupriavidus sp. Marseille-Q8015]